VWILKRTTRQKEKDKSADNAGIKKGIRPSTGRHRRIVKGGAGEQAAIEDGSSKEARTCPDFFSRDLLEARPN
jgi:hypothetical protein